jgi:hypothetical protein
VAVGMAAATAVAEGMAAATEGMAAVAAMAAMAAELKSAPIVRFLTSDSSLEEMSLPCDAIAAHNAHPFKPSPTHFLRRNYL